MRGFMLERDMERCVGLVDASAMIAACIWPLGSIKWSNRYRGEEMGHERLERNRYQIVHMGWVIAETD